MARSRSGRIRAGKGLDRATRGARVATNKGGQVNMKGSLGTATSRANTGATGVAYKKANRGQGVKAKTGISNSTSSRMP